MDVLVRKRSAYSSAFYSILGFIRFLCLCCSQPEVEQHRQIATLQVFWLPFRTGLMGAIRLAPARGHFFSLLRSPMSELRLQPIIELETRETLGFELLAGKHCCPGWVDSQWHQWYVTMADQLNRHAPASSLVFINVDSRQIVDPVIRASLENLMVARKCVVEWTEHESDYDTHASAIRWLRSWSARGVDIAVDDIGHGADGIGRVLSVQPAYAKLDAGLVRRGVENGEMRLLSHLHTLFSSLGCEVIAEGIETEDDAVHCRSAGIRYGQGFYFGCGSIPA